MIKDLNKGITSVAYNEVGLPSLIQGDAGKQIKYVYDSRGNKLLHTSSDGVKTFYNGSFVYEQRPGSNIGLKYILHCEGKYDLSLGGGTYLYHLNDHLGNTRLVVDSKGVERQQSSYYPLYVLRDSCYARQLKSKGFIALTNRKNWV